MLPPQYQNDVHWSPNGNMNNYKANNLMPRSIEEFTDINFVGKTLTIVKTNS
jgi:hypothetical protein